MEAFRKIYPEEFQKKFLIYGVRPDGRYLNKVRKTIISSDPVSNSDGSSFVKLGNTSVTAGITIKVEKPTISLINYQPTMDENGEISLLFYFFNLKIISH
jgi:exosome complex RNA-binding protein Rrp42 (RNase PH superfamily)